MTRTIVLGLTLAGTVACSDGGRPAPVPARSDPPAPLAVAAAPRATPVQQAAPALSPAVASRAARPAHDALWSAARAVDEKALSDLVAFFHSLPDRDLAVRFGRHDPATLRAAAPESVAALRRQTFRLEAAVVAQRAASGVFVDDAGPDGKVAFRLVWPVELGGGLQIAAHKPVVNAGTGSAVAAPRASWLFDFAPPQGWLAAQRAAPALTYRAVWKPVTARTAPVPILMVRVVRWQLFDGDRLLHEETDDR